MTYVHRRKSLMPLWLSEFSNLQYGMTELEEKDTLGYICFWKTTMWLRCFHLVDD